LRVSLNVPRLALNFHTSCLHLPSARITDVHHHLYFVVLGFGLRALHLLDKQVYH
jgi:hypothetical protein